MHIVCLSFSFLLVITSSLRCRTLIEVGTLFSFLIFLKPQMNSFFLEENVFKFNLQIANQILLLCSRSYNTITSHHIVCKKRHKTIFLFLQSNRGKEIERGRKAMARMGRITADTRQDVRAKDNRKDISFDVLKISPWLRAHFCKIIDCFIGPIWWHLSPPIWCFKNKILIILHAKWKICFSAELCVSPWKVAI